MKKLTAASVLAVLMTSVFSGVASAEIASKSYVDAQDVILSTDIATKADQATTYTKTEVDTALADKANTADLGTLATMNSVGTTEINGASVTKPKLSVDVQASLDKADTAIQTADLSEYATKTALAGKEDITNKSNNIVADTGSTTKYTTVNAVESYVNTALSDKADIDDLATKADVTYVDTQDAALTAAIADKADTTYVDTGLATKADQATTYTKTEVDTAVSTKSDTTYVDTQDAALSTAIAAKADTTYVDTQDTVLTTAIAAKADSATTLAGYGITDAMTSTAINTALDLKANTADLGTLATAAPGACSDPTNKCVLTFDGTTYSWEVVER